MDCDVVVIGAGFSGIGAGIFLAREGIRSFRILEERQAPGGTWRDNTYPGVAVDLPSSSYCFSFEDEYPWSRRFATGSELQAYASHCIHRYGLEKHIYYEAKVLRTAFDCDGNRWCTQLADGSQLYSRYVIAATGQFHQPKYPSIDGLQDFKGPVVHSARWNHSLKLDGLRVGVIGTGASAVQLVPHLAAGARHLVVFQRTPIWIGPRLDLPCSSWSLFLKRLLVVRKVLRHLSEAQQNLLTLAAVNFRRFPLLVRLTQSMLALNMRFQLRGTQLGSELIPKYPLGCKRPSISNSYLRTFARPNVELCTEPIRRITQAGVRAGAHHVGLDVLVLATGFKVTERGNIPTFEVTGKGGRELGQLWELYGWRAYAGVAVHGFPNFFLTIGPYSGGINWFPMLESHLAHIVRCIIAARDKGATRLEIGKASQDQYMKHMLKRAEGTVFKDPGCAGSNSYYLDARGEAALPLPHAPWWRNLRNWRVGTRGYVFSSIDERNAP